MRSGYRLATFALAFGLLGGACNGNSANPSPSTGGKSSTGGSPSNGGTMVPGGNTSTGGTPATGGKTGGTGGAATGGNTTSPGGAVACSNSAASVVPCGGDVVGVWNVTPSCLKLTGDMDVSLSSLGCKTVPVTGSLLVSGTWEAKAGGAYVDNTTTKGSVSFPLADNCLSISSVPVDCSKIGSIFKAVGWTTADCTVTAGKCGCVATVDQVGGLGVVSPWADKAGTYSTSANGLNIDDNVDYSYCVAGSTLTMTPKPTIIPVTGAIVLQKNGTTPGTGGAIGQGGIVSSGGVARTGGVVGSGGTAPASGGSARDAGSDTATSTGGIVGGSPATGGVVSVGGAAGDKPCDIFAAASNKCAAAHSTVRALYAAYNGPLYQVKRKSDNTTKDIGVLSAGGLADSSIQDTFCTGTTCTITKVYDQSGNGNFLSAQTADAEDPSVRPAAGVTHVASSATQEQLTVGGKKVYSLYMKVGQAYWRDGSKSGMPLGSSPQGIYMVTSGKHVNGGCCFDYGNAATSRTMSGGGTMDALYFGLSGNGWGTGNGTGPWVMADLEGGLFAQGGGGKNDKNMSMTSTYVTAVEKNNGSSEFTLRGSDATQGSLATFYKGKLPSGYVMKKQGAIVLGSGGDCCYSNTNGSEGTLYEAAIVTGYPSDATDDAIQTNVISAGYGK